MSQRTILDEWREPREVIEGREDDKIVDSPVSEIRKEAFLREYRADRARASTSEVLFKTAGGFVHSPEPNDAKAFGFNVLLRKGPFVDGSNWAPYTTWEFALAAERALLGRLEGHLRLSAADTLGPVVERSAEAIVVALSGMHTALSDSGLWPSLFVITGPVATDLKLELYHRVTPNWTMPEIYRRPWIDGALLEHPILHIQLEGQTSPALYAADLRRLAQMTKYGEINEFKLETFDEAQAEDLLTRNPALIDAPPPEDGNHSERVRQLRLRVGLRLFESCAIELLDANAVRGRPLGQ
jgi:hypothetical protein